MYVISWNDTMWSKALVQAHILRCKNGSGDIDAVDKEGKTLLWEAVFMGCTSIVKMLLEAGANADIPSNKGRIPVLEATLIGNGELVQLLVPYTRNIHLPDATGRTAISLAHNLRHIPGYENLSTHLFPHPF